MLDDRLDIKRSTGHWSVYAIRIGLLIIVGSIVVGGFILYQAATTAMKAEENLHATLFVVRLVEQYVHEQGEWPESWNQLEEMPFARNAYIPLNADLSAIRIGGARDYEWPANSKQLRRSVKIDFQIDPRQVGEQDAMDFVAIEPIGPSFEYRDYGIVQSLLETIRQSNQGATNGVRQQDPND